MSDWVNESKQEITPEHYGFVYEIINLKTGRRYIGRKYFTRAATKTVKGKKKKIRAESNWVSYYGSNKTLLEDVKQEGKDQFVRKIIHLCRSRSECSYYESKEIFQRDALIDPDYYNEWVSCRIQSSHILAKANKTDH